MPKFVAGDRVIALIDIPLYEISTGRGGYESCVVMGVVKSSRGSRGVVKRILSGREFGVVEVVFPGRWPSDIVGRLEIDELAHQSIVDTLAELAE